MSNKLIQWSGLYLLNERSMVKKPLAPWMQKYELQIWIVFLITEDPTGMPKVKNWGSKHFGLDSVINMHDIETPREPVFVSKTFKHKGCVAIVNLKKFLRIMTPWEVWKRVLLPWTLDDINPYSMSYSKKKIITWCFSHQKNHVEFISKFWWSNC